MAEYSFNLKITAADQAEAGVKMQAVTKLLNGLDTKALSKLGHIVASDPTKVAWAKKFLGI